jgi:hypothetical protein
LNKKIFAILGIFVIAMISCAYAADSTDNTITISDVNFTIPEGFTENVDEATVNESGYDDGYNYVLNSKTFEKDDTAINIVVADYEQDISNDLIKDMGKETTINNITGYNGDTGFIKLFAYVQDKKIVTITIINEKEDNLLEKILS